ncbi:MAG: ATP-binding protein [Candidatus Coprovivens sp.]
MNNIQIYNKNDSIIANIISSIDTKNTHIIIDEQIKSEDLPFEEIELQRIFTNIVNNAVTAMNVIGNIYVRTYYDINTIVISIENDGPKIDNKIINKIFEAGVSTKKQSWKSWIWFIYSKRNCRK